MIHKVILALVCVYTVTSCAQQQTKQTTNKEYNLPMIHQEINANNIVESIAAKVQHYKKEPMYFIRPLQHNCVYEILVNDIPVYEDYGIEKLATPKSINQAILQSGPQTVTVRLYPLGDAMKRAYGEGESIQTLLKKTKMEVSVVKYEAYNISKSLDDEIEVIRHTSPTQPGTQAFIGAGLPYYEYTFEFEAVVPYQNKGWLDGEDLTQFDKEELEQQAVRYYKQVQSVYKNKNADALAKIHYGSIKILAQAKYLSKEDIQEIWNEVLGDFDLQTIELMPVENYIMRFYGNGKIVALRHPSHEPVDHRLRGNSAFWFKYKTNTSIRVSFLSFDLNLAKGQSLEALQTIP